jgi:hypothetical protein
MPGILDSYSAMMGFPALQQPAQPMQEFPSMQFAHVPERPRPDLSALHPLAAQLMGKVIGMPAPLPAINLPSVHPMSLAAALQVANAVAAGPGPTPFAPLMAGAQRQ